MTRCVTILLLLLLATGLGCSREGARSSSPHNLQVITTIFPLYDFCRNVGGDRVEVSLLLPPGVEPHSFEPKPEDVLRVSRAALFVYTNRYMEPWAEAILKGAGGRETEAVDASAGVTFLREKEGEEHAHGAGEKERDHGGMDPHVWLNPANARVMVDNILAALERKDPANREYYAKNAAAYRERLALLDEKFRAGLADCRSRVIFHGGHYAFGYLAERYGLRYVSAYGLSANAEPTPARLAELIDGMKRNGVHVIFYEEIFSPRVAETIARETGATLLKLHGVHNLSREELAGGATYLSLMEQNLRNLRAGLQCR
jgi:zinc transport system substrate-binding protein